jgi:hypothetical protein
MTRHGVWIGNGFIRLLQFETTINYSTIANSCTLQFTMARTKSSHFSMSSLVVVWERLPILDSSAPLFTSLPAAYNLTAPPDCNSWPLTPIRVWPTLPTTRCHRLALTSDSDRIENTSSNSSSVVACVSVAAVA